MTENIRVTRMMVIAACDEADRLQKIFWDAMDQHKSDEEITAAMEAEEKASAHAADLIRRLQDAGLLER